MVDKTIDMKLDDILALDYLIEEISDDSITVNKGDSSDLSYISKDITILNPSSTGTYTLEIDTQTVEINVTEYIKSESNSKLRNRWILDTVGDGTVEDIVGSADGTNNGVTSTTGDWTGGNAGNGDGSSTYIDTTKLGSFGSSMDTNFSVAFSISTTISTTGTDAHRVGGTRNTANGGSTDFNIQMNRTADGEVTLDIADANNEDIIVESSGSNITDGNPHRIVLNKKDNSASGIDIWVDQNKQSISTVADQAFGSPADFDHNFLLFATNNDGTTDSYINAIIDDFCIYTDSLTESEIKSYNNPWE